MDWAPVDFSSEPDNFLPKVDNETIREWGLAVNDLWNYLSREVTTSLHPFCMHDHNVLYNMSWTMLAVNDASTCLCIIQGELLHGDDLESLITFPGANLLHLHYVSHIFLFWQKG